MDHTEQSSEQVSIQEAEPKKKRKKKVSKKQWIAIFGFALLLVAAAVVLLVLMRPVPITHISFTQEELVLKEGDSLTAEIRFEPADATEGNLTWKTSNRGVAVVEDGVITGIGEGSCLISVTAESGVKDTVSVKVEAPMTEAEQPLVGSWALFALVEGEKLRYSYGAEPILFMQENRTASLHYEGGDYTLEDWRHEGREGSYESFSCEGADLIEKLYFCLDSASPYDNCLLLLLEDGRLLIFHKTE